MENRLKPFRVMGHPVHVPLTHFPLALWTIAFGGDLVYYFQPDLFWWQFAYWNITAGLLIGVLTLLTGFWDYITLPENKPFTEKTANWHMGVMLGAFGLFTASFYFHRLGPQSGHSWMALGFSAAGTLFLQFGGWLGGQLVYHHGVGYDD